MLKTGTSRIALALVTALVIAVGSLFFLLGHSGSGAAAGLRPGLGAGLDESADLTTAQSELGGRTLLKTPTANLGSALGVRAPGTGVLRGRVLDRATGAPVPGLRVDLAPLPTGAPEAYSRILGLLVGGLDVAELVEPVASVASDGSGSFEFTGVAVGEYFVQARGAHHVPDAATPAHVVSSGAGGPLDVYVRAGGRIVGVVRDAAGRPIESARVVVMPGVGALFEALRRGDLCSLEARTGASGAFVVAGVPPGVQWEVTVFGVGMALSQVGGVRVRGGEDTSVEVLADLGGELVGRVIAAPLEGGAPVPLAGARVFAAPRGLRALPFAREVLQRTQGATDAQGRYRLVGVPAGEVDVLAFADGLAPAKGPSALAISGQTTAVSDFTLARGQQVAGRVIDTSGAPLAGVRVTWDTVDYSGMNFDFSLGPLFVHALDGFEFPTTDADGRFTAGAFPGRPHYGLRFAKPGYGRKREFWDGEQPELEVVLAGDCTIEGVVMDALAHTPVTAFRVKSTNRFFSGEQYLRGELDPGELQEHPQGRFSLQTGGPVVKPETEAGREPEQRHTAAGKVDLLFRAPGYLAAEVQEIEVREGETTRGVIVELYPGGVVRGRIEDAGGAPVAGAQVFLKLTESDPARPGAASAFGGGGLPGGFAPYAASLGFLGGRSVLSDPDGRFELLGAEPGVSRVVAVHRDFTVGASEPLAVSLDEAPVEVTLVLEAGGVIHGLVSDRHGRAIPGAVVLAVSPSNLGTDPGAAPRGGFFEGRADETGQYRIEQVDAGVYFLVMARGDAALSPTSLLGSLNFNLVTLSAGEQVEYDIVDASAGATRVFGRVLASDLEITRGQVVAMSFEAENMLGFDLKLARIAADGTYEFGGLISGEYQLKLEGLGPDVGSVELIVEIPDQPEYRLDLRLPDGRIEGRVTDAATGEPLASIRVRAESSDRVQAQGLVGQMIGSKAGVYSEWTDDSGHYSFARLSAGEYQLVAGGASVWRGATHTASTLRVVTLHTDEVQHSVDFRLQSALAVQVLVLDEHGQPVPSARVLARHAARPEDIQASGGTDSEGACELMGLVPGAYDVTVGHGEYADTQRLGVELEPGDSKHLELRLVRGVAVSVLVLGSKGRPISGGAGRLVPERGGGQAEAEALLKSMLDGSGVSNEGGLLELGRFAPGEYRLEVRRGLAEYSERVTISDGGDLRLRARLR